MEDFNVDKCRYLECICKDNEYKRESNSNCIKYNGFKTKKLPNYMWKLYLRSNFYLIKILGF